MRHAGLLPVCAVLLALSACDSSTEPLRPAALTAVAAVEQSATVGSLAPAAPAVRVTTASGAPVAGARVRFTVLSGGGAIDGSEVSTGADGIAAVTGWQLGTEPGFNSVAASLDALPNSQVRFEAVGLPTDCTRLIKLDLAPGEFARHTASASGMPCLSFDIASAAGHEYLVLLENMPRFGPTTTALFPATASDPASPTAFSYTLRSVAAAPAPTAPVAAQRIHAPAAPAEMHSWDFGAGRIYEYEPPEPDRIAAARAGAPMLLARSGALVDFNSAAADPQVGDTVYNIRLEGIPRLGLNGARNDHRAVIRHISPELIIAEDVRLPELTRVDSSVNTPLTPAILDSIATEYSNNVRPQGDRLFEGRHNSAVESSSPARVLVVHTLMYADNIWGYTYSATNHFAFDYWVGETTSGSIRGANQHPQRVADNLFMHEIAHMRHWGLLQRNGLPVRGNRWLVEGFARFTERLPIAARLLGTTAPSRTAPVVLPRDPVFNNSYFRADVPTFLNAGTAVGGGYQHSSYVFDYFADQVALAGGDWMQAVREFVVAAGRADVLDATVQRWLPGIVFDELLTRARIALYTDDLEGVSLPAWTQYHQYQLRASRPAGSQADKDPRVTWIHTVPGNALEVTGSIDAGAAIGYIIDGRQAAGRSMYTISGGRYDNAVMSVTRIR
ncbi:hypothetical protein BH23GEM10_BH23GEM10_02580 [soil metagenome]